MPFEPLPPGGVRVPNTNFYRAPEFVADDLTAFGIWAADEIERAIVREGPESVAAVYLEPGQNSGGCFPPPPGDFQRVPEICGKEGLPGNVKATGGAFRWTLEKLHDLPIVGDVRGDGYFYGIEMVKDKATRETFDDDESERLLRGFLSHALFDAGLICRADDRGDTVIQLSPPLTCTQEHFDEIEQILRTVLTEAWSHI